MTIDEFFAALERRREIGSGATGSVSSDGMACFADNARLQQLQVSASARASGRMATRARGSKRQITLGFEGETP